MEKRLFEKAFTLPFTHANRGEFLSDSEGESCLQFIDAKRFSERDVILNCINGNEVFFYLSGPVTHEDGAIYDVDDRLILRIRGWAHLTGIGGLNLSGNDAEAIQKDLADHIAERLNRK